MLSKKAKPPYYAVIFTSLLKQNTEEYQRVSKELEDLALELEGFIGYETAREELGIFISYWNSEEAIKKWKEEAFHQIAQKRGREEWYKSFEVKVARVERSYSFESED